jgi:hypothetical protein
MVFMRILNMSALRQRLSGKARFILACLIAFMGVLYFGLVQPAYADNSEVSPKYIGADGTDLTAMVECLPKTLSQPNLALALTESGNDFLQKVFDLRDNYDDYKVESVEAEYLTCMQSKGVTPAVMR